MTPVQLLAELHRLGVEVAVNKGKLAIRDPRGTFTHQLRAELRRNKEAVVDLLTTRPHTRPYTCASCGRFFFAEPAVLCYWCRNEPDRKRTNAGT